MSDTPDPRSVPVIVACMPADEADFVSRGASFDRTCKNCGIRLAIAPSSRRLLQDNKRAITLCLECAYKAISIAPDIEAGILPEALDEMQNPIPNTWRKRN